VPTHLLKQLLVHVLEACRSSRRAPHAGNAAAWASALTALLRHTSNSDSAFGKSVQFANGPRHSRGWNLLCACLNLRVLTLSGTGCDAALAAVADCQHLTRLDVSHSPQVTVSGACALVSGSARHSLAVLLAHDCALVDDAFVCAVTVLPRLAYLDVSATSITDGALSHLVQPRPHDAAPLPLTHLRLARCSRIRGRPDSMCWADALCSALPSLQRLDVSGTTAMLVYEAQLHCDTSPQHAKAALLTSSAVTHHSSGGAFSGPGRRRAPVTVSALGASSAAAPKLWTRDSEDAFPEPADDAQAEADGRMASSWGGPSIASLMARVASDALCDIGGSSRQHHAVHEGVIGGVKRPAAVEAWCPTGSSAADTRVRKLAIVMPGG